MSKKNVAPVYLVHKQSGKGRTLWRDSLGIRRSRLHPGTFGTKSSMAAHAKLCLELAASPTGAGADPEALSVVELLDAFREHAKKIYRHPTTGKPTDELRQIESTIRFIRPIYGDDPAASFGPLALRATREKFVAEGWSRKTEDARVDRIRRIFRWGVSHQLIGPEVLQSLEAVEGLRMGRCEAPDYAPVRPAAMSDVQKVLPLLSPTVSALLVVQLHSGARAGELVRMRVGDIDRTDPDAWVFKPGSHKTTWKGKSRTIYFGERCREALAPLILKAGSPEAYVFSPAREEIERLARRAEERVTKLWPSHARRNHEKRVGERRKRKPRDHYTTGTYRKAIERACEAAGVPRFTPHRLRHLAATRVRAELGVDAARALLGHSLASITEVYSSEVDRALALKAVRQFG